jgi:hypothetical protein
VGGAGDCAETHVWFEVSPDLTVKLLHSSSPVEEDCLKATQAVEEFVEGHKNR